MLSIFQSSSAKIFQKCILVQIFGDNPGNCAEGGEACTEKEEGDKETDLVGCGVEPKLAEKMGDMCDERSILFIRREEYSQIRCALIDSTTIEILGVRKSGKSCFLMALFKANWHLHPALIVTKGPVPQIKGSFVYTATNIDTLGDRLSYIIQERDLLQTRIVGIDSLSTILYANEDAEKEKHIFFMFRVLNSLGIRIVVISSLIYITKKTSDFYSRSFLFRALY